MSCYHTIRTDTLPLFYVRTAATAAPGRPGRNHLLLHPSTQLRGEAHGAQENKILTPGCFIGDIDRVLYDGNDRITDDGIDHVIYDDNDCINSASLL
uniref:Uncharacterized protein n=1 Tax=Oryza meridionalis TaxID=40149 RepID=A0A0E0F624_9ORYZ